MCFKCMASFSLDSEFYCCKCGNRGLDIIRIKGKERKAGHLKRLYCFTCKEEINHVECKTFTHYTHEDFLLEFDYHNFNQEGQRILPYGQFRDKLHKEGIL